MSELPQILNSETVLAEAESKFAQTKQLEENLKQRRNDGKLLYDNWQSSSDWHLWRMQQLEQQNWKCACCGQLMRFGKKIYLPNGSFTLEPQHPTVDHVLPKSLFPEFALDKENLVMVCWSCNRRKSNYMAAASRMRHRKLRQKLNW